MAFYPFAPRCPIASSQLPLTLISLEDWALVTLTGIDSEKYLQSQVTADINQMTEYQHLLTAHCNPKGKMWSIIRLFRHNNGFVLIERKSLRHVQMNEMKKYAIFSKVNIAADDEHILLGVAGFRARAVLKNLFNKLPNEDVPLVNDKEMTLLWFKYPSERFLLVINIETAERITESLHGEAQLNNSQQWLALNIEAGEPVIDLINSGKFIPQATNLQMLNGISFKKGCYIGQEIVTRAKFRGVNKRSLWFLSGYTNRIPEIGEDLERKIGEDWRYAGTVLAAVQLDDGCLLVQAVINNIEVNGVFRLRNDINTLNIKPLPYFA